MERKSGVYRNWNTGERKMKNIKISVVMPCLNSAVYIGKAIESVIGQTLKELELIIVDAGSTDGTLEIIEEFIC